MGYHIATGSPLAAEAVEHLIAGYAHKPGRELTRLSVVAVANGHNGLDKGVLKDIICQVLVCNHEGYVTKDFVLVSLQ